ncbi:hypothetical protein GALL_235030 [mine drainage metagenome]|uniref:Uncharacterized protein n=1 Tax=mine drainage metagenome TaxID=410659 RepID=A0A1J5RFJ0_9ZZZZ
MSAAADDGVSISSLTGAAELETRITAHCRTEAKR